MTPTFTEVGRDDDGYLSLLRTTGVDNGLHLKFGVRCTFDTARARQIAHHFLSALCLQLPRTSLKCLQFVFLCFSKVRILKVTEYLLK